MDEDRPYWNMEIEPKFNTPEMKKIQDQKLRKRIKLLRERAPYFTRLFKANGIQLPRDARQQVLEGIEIVPDSTFSNIMPGDLVFFGSGKRITHVGLSLGGYDFIHQDRDVHIDSFDSSAENFNAFRKKTLKNIKRIIQ